MMTMPSASRLASLLAILGVLACGGGGGGGGDANSCEGTAPCVSRVTMTASTMQIGGGRVDFDITVHNPTAETVSGIGYQYWVAQGSAMRAAGGSVGVYCPETPNGEVPPGDCTWHSDAGAFNEAFGTGTLVAGPAALVVELSDADENVIDTFSVPITLTE
jgi:hypothetical protein